ncbi:MAG: class I SAM-dependent methyltransferase [Gorillibacterium sp.]|nr:class I SAM-dependent methyltransferase [Gorillibacterium sp.]
MMPEGNLKSNIERFNGFANVYDSFRPEAPLKVVELIITYLGKKPAKVVDLGCGTGLSSFIWRGHADQIVGIEPNEDMIAKAREKSEQEDSEAEISFLAGYSNQLPFAAKTVDAITCSQSFHWMEPFSTLKEVSRVLTQGGVFAAYDCDWPVTIDWQVEASYNNLISKTERIIEQTLQEGNKAIKRNKQQHLQNMRDSNVFRYTKDIVFHNMEKCNAERYLGLVLSQGGIQTVFKLGSEELDTDITQFATLVNKHFQGRTLDVMFSYRMCLGVK